MSSGNEVEQQTFDGASTQKWKFVYYGGGNIYTIRSAQNNSYYLGVENNSTDDGANIVLRTGTITSGMKWRITQGNEGWKICAFSDTSMVLATNSSNATPEEKLILGDWMDNNSYCDEWIVPVPNTAIQLEAQTGQNWCWVASAYMASTKYMISPISQASAAVYVMGGIKTLSPSDIQKVNNDRMGNVGEIMQAMRFIVGGNIGVYGREGRIYTESVLRSLLDSNNVVIIGRGTTSEGHCSVIYGYYWDAKLNQYMYDVFDPLPRYVGDSYSRSYDWICDGDKGLASEPRDGYRWTSFVVFTIGSYAEHVSANVAD